MTVTQLHRASESDSGFTISDLFDFSMPGDGHLYEIFEGKLIVSPPPAMPHIFVTADLRDMLFSAKPSGLTIVEGAAIVASENDYYIPDLMVLPDSARGEVRRGVRPDEVRLAVEVISPSSASYDNLMKRHLYAKAGLAHYWIADPRARTIRVLKLEDSSYLDLELVGVGQSYTVHEPFEVTIEPAKVFRQ